MRDIKLDSVVEIITGPYRGHKGTVVIVGDWGTDTPYGIYLAALNLQVWMDGDEFRIDTTKRKGENKYEFNKRFH